MPIDKQTKLKAEGAWARTGQPFYMLGTMRDDELTALAELIEPGGTVVAGFSDKVGAIINNYYESRKASPPEDSQPDEVNDVSADAVHGTGDR